MMTLYHGSHVAVTSPLVSAGRRYLDFGQGFYLTSLRRQAEKWASIVASRKGRRAEGVLNVYSFNDTLAAEEGVRFKHFDSYDIEWLDYVVACRGGKDASLEYDVVEGGVANGNPKSVINCYALMNPSFCHPLDLQSKRKVSKKCYLCKKLTKGER